MVLGKLPGPGRPTIWISVGQGPIALAVGAGGGCLVVFRFNGPLRQYFSLYRAVSQREGERGERIDESKNVQTIPSRTYCKRIRPLPWGLFGHFYSPLSFLSSFSLSLGDGPI